MKNTTVEGGCLCGDVRYRITADRGFCGNCGAQPTYEGGADDIGVTTVTLDNPNTYPPKYRVEVSEKPPWVELWDLD